MKTLFKSLANARLFILQRGNEVNNYGFKKYFSKRDVKK